MEVYMYIIPVILLVGCVTLLVYGIPNLRQGRFLSNPLRLADLKDHIDELVVVSGEPEPTDEVYMRLHRSKRRQILWHRIERQEKVSRGRSSYWRTVRTKVKKTDFNLHFPDGGKVFVYCNPTEVQNSGSRTSGGGMTHGSTRTINTWLPMVKRLTVMGRLVLDEEGAAIEPHQKEGMFFSPLAPREAAKKETQKGWACLAGSVACAVGALIAGIMVLA